ncbi:hypothetical protein [Enterobacter phage 01_vB_Eclo_IJM]|nr:hypothetical protein [Enterobacter phage 01_vB_Eclo_IJM]
MLVSSNGTTVKAVRTSPANTFRNRASWSELLTPLPWF